MKIFEKKIDYFLEIVKDWLAIDRKEKINEFLSKLDDKSLLLLAKYVYLVNLQFSIESNTQDRVSVWSGLDKGNLEKIGDDYIKKNFTEDEFSFEIKNKLNSAYLRNKDKIGIDFSSSEPRVNNIWEEVSFPDFKNLLKPDEQIASLLVADIKRFENKILEKNDHLNEKREGFYKNLLYKLANVYFADVKFLKKDRGFSFFSHYKNLTKRVSNESVNEMVTNKLKEFLEDNSDVMLSAINIKKLVKENGPDEQKKIMNLLGLDEMVHSIVSLDKNGKNIVINKRNHKIISNLNVLLSEESGNQYFNSEISSYIFNHNINIANNWETVIDYYFKNDVLPIIKKLDNKIGSKIKFKKMDDGNILKIEIADDITQVEKKLLQNLFKNVLKIGFVANQDERLLKTEIVINNEFMKHDREVNASHHKEVKKALKF